MKSDTAIENRWVVTKDEELLLSSEVTVPHNYYRQAHHSVSV